MEISWTFGMVCVVLIVFGWAYNGLVAWMQKHGHEAYTAFWVVFGVAVTVAAGWPLIGTQAFLTLTILFTCSGLPMIVGSMVRHAQERTAAQASLDEFIRERLGDSDAETSGGRVSVPPDDNQSN